MGVGWVFLHGNMEMALSHAERLEIVGDISIMRHGHQFDRMGGISSVSNLQMEMGVGYGNGKPVLLELRSVHAIHSNQPVLDSGREKAVRGDKGKEKKRMKTHKK